MIHEDHLSWPALADQRLSCVAAHNVGIVMNSFIKEWVSDVFEDCWVDDGNEMDAIRFELVDNEIGESFISREVQREVYVIIEEVNVSPYSIEREVRALSVLIDVIDFIQIYIAPAALVIPKPIEWDQHRPPNDFMVRTDYLFNIVP